MRVTVIAILVGFCANTALAQESKAPPAGPSAEQRREDEVAVACYTQAQKVAPQLAKQRPDGLIPYRKSVEEFSVLLKPDEWAFQVAADCIANDRRKQSELNSHELT